MIDLSRLNEHSKKIANLLFTDHPEWIEFASLWVNHLNKANPYNLIDCYLAVEVPSPTGQVIRNLNICTTGSGTAIHYFDYFHVQFGFGQTIETEYVCTKEFITDFLNEELIVICKKHSFLGFHWTTQPGIISLNEIQGMKSSKISCIRSWKGTYDTGELKYKKL
jgi:hypothetical protein